MNQIFILDRNENIVAILSGNTDDSGCHFFNSNLVLEISKGASLTFDVDVNESEVVEHIKEENMVIVFDGENYRLLIIKEISDIHQDSCLKEVYCEDASCELIDEIIYDEVSGSVEMGTVLASILKGTRWQIGEVDNTYIRNLKPEFKLKSVLNGIYELAKQYNAEVDFTVEFAGNKIISRKVHMKKAFGKSIGKRFEFGKDTTSIKRTVNTADIKTAIVPFGKTDEETGEALTIKGVSWSKPAKALNKPIGQTYLEDEDATELWGYKGTGPKRRARWIAITFEECEDENELINLAYMQLNRFNKPKVSYEAEVVDLYRMMGDESYAHEKVGLGDLASIIDFEFIPALALNSRVVKLELDLNDPSNSKATLGTIVESIIDKDLKTQIEELNVKVGAISNIDLSDIEERLDEVLEKTGTGTWEQVEEINNLIFNNSVGYHFMGEDKGIWVFDKPVTENPTKAVAIKGGVIGLAKWDTQLQKWNVGTFIDGTSVNASMINTGTLKADRIETNALTVNHLNQELKTIVNSVGDKATREEVTTAISTAVGEINLSVSSIYSTKEEASSLESRIADAEFKISPEAIINTVKSSSETNGEKTFAQTSDVKQTAKEVTYDFLSGIGTNLISNSMFKDRMTTGWKFWTSSQWGDSGYYKDGDMWIAHTSTTSHGLFYTESFDAKPNTQYTVSFAIKKESNVSECVVRIIWQEVGGNVNENVATATIINPIFDGERHSYTFTSPNVSNIKKCMFLIRIDKSLSSANSYLVNINKPCMMEGVVAPYQPAPNEIINASTIIDASGVTVKNGALKVENNSGQVVLSGDSKGNIDLISYGNNVKTSLGNGQLVITNNSNGDYLNISGNSILLYDYSTTDERASIEKTASTLTISNWSQKNTPVINLNTDKVVVANDLNVTGALRVGGTEILNGKDSWLRTKGDNGWYNSTYAGGWHMTDSTWIRAFNGKSVYTPGIIQADNGFQVGGNIMARIESNGDIKGQDIYGKAYRFNSGSASNITARSTGGFDLWSSNGGSRFSLDGSNMKIYKVVNGTWTVIAG